MYSIPAGASPLSLCTRRSETFASSAAALTAARRLSITLWLTAVTPTRFPVLASSTMTRAPLKVFPDPGGPWIGRTSWSSAEEEAARHVRGSRSSSIRRTWMKAAVRIPWSRESGMACGRLKYTGQLRDLPWR